MTEGGVSSLGNVCSSGGTSTVNGISSIEAGSIWSGLGTSGLRWLVWHVTEGLEEAERQLDLLRVDTFALMPME